MPGAHQRPNTLSEGKPPLAPRDHAGYGSACVPNKFAVLIWWLSWGAERRVLGARAPTKVSEEILQWAGTHKVLAEKVRGNGNFR